MDDQKVYLPLWDIENILPILNKIAIFAALSDKQLYTIFKLLQKVSYQEDEVIFKQGSEPSHIYIIRSGEVRMVADTERGPLELVSFRTGDCFGETALIGIQPHSASALAVKDTELIVLSHGTMLSIFETDKELFGMLILNIAREACRRLHKTDEVLLHYVLSERG